MNNKNGFFARFTSQRSRLIIWGVIGLVLMSNLGAIIDSFLHPEIKYFDSEHLIVGGSTGLVLGIMFLIILMYIDRLKETVRNSSQSEEVLRESEERFRLFYDSSLDGIMLTVPDGRILSANPSACRMFERTEEEIKQLGRGGALDMSDPRVALAIEERNQTGRFIGELTFIRKSGEKFPVELTSSLFKDKDGNIRTSLIFRDISERKRAEERLRESEERYHNLFNSMDEGLAINEAVLDENGDVVDYIILSVNPAFEKHTIYKTEQVLGKRATEVYQMFPEYIRDWWRNHSQIEVSAHTEMYHEPSKRWFHITTTPPEGKRFATIFIDITERKQAEVEINQLNAELEKRVEERTLELRDAQEQLVRHEKLSVLGQLSSSVGHELRNPLSVIASAIYYLKLIQPDADDKVKQYLGVIDQEVRNSDKIISDLLDFARVKSVDREPVSVSDLICRTLERFPVPEFVEVTLDTPADLPQVFVDPSQMIQVLGNLTVNAWQAMRGLTADAPKGGQLYLHSILQNDMINITVQDNGVGISLENMKKIFEPLFTTKTKGIGLGLAVSQKLVDANGGRIEVESEAGKGTSFHVYLPIYRVVLVVARDETVPVIARDKESE